MGINLHLKDPREISSQTLSLHSTTGYDANDPFQVTVGHTRKVQKPVPYPGTEVYC